MTQVAKKRKLRRDYTDQEIVDSARRVNPAMYEAGVALGRTWQQAVQRALRSP